jgi:hypothetical protein
MKEFYTLKAEDYANVSQSPFKLQHPNGTKVKLDTNSFANQTTCNATGVVRLNAGSEVTFTAVRPPGLFKSPGEPWCAIQEKVTQKYLRHCYGTIWLSDFQPNNGDFAWLFYKQADGTYQLFNPFNDGVYIGYDSKVDSLTLGTVVNWTIVPQTTPDAPVAPAAPAAPAPASKDYKLYIFGIIALLFCLLMLWMAMGR